MGYLQSSVFSGIEKTFMDVRLDVDFLRPHYEILQLLPHPQTKSTTSKVGRDRYFLSSNDPYMSGNFVFPKVLFNLISW